MKCLSAIACKLAAKFSAARLLFAETVMVFGAMYIRHVVPLFFAAIFFETADFMTGVTRSWVEAKRAGAQFIFYPHKAWRTLIKLFLIIVGTAMAEALDLLMSGGQHWGLARWYTAACCGVEFCSFLGNAAVISNWSVFLYLRKVMSKRINDAAGANVMPDGGMCGDLSPDTPMDRVTDKDKEGEPCQPVQVDKGDSKGCVIPTIMPKKKDERPTY